MRDIVFAKPYLLLLLVSYFLQSQSQFQSGTSQYDQLLETNIGLLNEELQSHPDVELTFYPERALPDNNQYRFDFPLSENYRLNIIMDPCKGQQPDCCMNVFGTNEYPKLKIDGQEVERVNRKIVLANDSDILANFELVYEDGSMVPTDAMRGADDEYVIDYDCDMLQKPYSRCRGKNYAHRRSDLRPPCLDNNQTIDVMKGCQNSDGEHFDHCVQVAYTQNAFIGVCDGEFADDDHCGTFLEIHQKEGSMETNGNEFFKIAEVKLDTRDVSGYYTTTLNLTWDNDPNKILCTYIENFIRVGSIVFVNRAGSPTCCCPKPFKDVSRVGSYACPIGASGRGPYAAEYKTLAEEVATETDKLLYPFCPTDLNASYDSILCSAYDRYDKIHYTRPCAPVYQSIAGDTDSHTSIDLDGLEYADVCPYFSNCALTTEQDPNTGGGKCKKEDWLYTFIGSVGRVTAIDSSVDPRIISVTFNDGRTSYDFREDLLKLEPGMSMYEVWWVVRTPSEFVVQKRKGFNVTSPQCTFDYVNNRYFPYAILENGVPKL
jgi:hypothetical protein